LLKGSIGPTRQRETITPSDDSLPDEGGSYGEMMRAFLVACVAAVVIAIAAAVVLDRFVQQTSAAAFTLPSARI
jgi:hypothetical protein